jgi:enolase
LDAAAPRSTREMASLIESLVADLPIVSVEDPLAEEDWQGWRELCARLPVRVQLIGDDLIATNPDRLRRAIDERAANAVLIKVNQIGTLSDALYTVCLARQAGWRTIVSARSGETEDTTIADLAVATAAEQIKIGCIARGERTAKYNRLLRIEQYLRVAAGTLD